MTDASAVLGLLGPNLAIMAAVFVLLWLINLRTRDPSFIDGWWALGMVVLAWLSFARAGGDHVHGWVLTGLCTLWGLRLGVYLLWRWRTHGADPRYSKMMAEAKEKQGWGYPLASLLIVFLLQWPLQFIAALPVQVGQLGAGALGPAAWAGAVLALFGIAFETIGDAQLVAFRADPANKGRVLDSGLWRYTRHPNYFGEACLWWGLWLVAADSGAALWALPGPVLTTLLLTRVSGVPTVEGSIARRRPDYEAYVRRTSGFVPMPPKPS